MKQILAMLVLRLGIFAIFNFSDVVRLGHRGLRGAGCILRVGGGQASSTGQRMILLLIDFELIKDNLFFGVADGVMPTYEYLKSRIPSLNEEIYEIKTLAGSHSECLRNWFVRVYFWWVCFVGFFLYPLYLVSCKLRVWSTAAGLLRDLWISCSRVVFWLTIQVFNLKMTMSFYMLCLAIFWLIDFRELRRASMG